MHMFDREHGLVRWLVVSALPPARVLRTPCAFHAYMPCHAVPTSRHVRPPAPLYSPFFRLSHWSHPFTPPTANAFMPMSYMRLCLRTLMLTRVHLCLHVCVQLGGYAFIGEGIPVGLGAAFQIAYKCVRG